MSTKEKVQEEGRSVMRQDYSARTGSTFLDHTALVDPAPGGRFARQEHLKPQIIKGGPGDYPAGSNGWSGKREMDEPPLGYSVDEVR